MIDTDSNRKNDYILFIFSYFSFKVSLDSLFRTNK